MATAKRGGIPDDFLSMVAQQATEAQQGKPKAPVEAVRESDALKRQEPSKAQDASSKPHAATPKIVPPASSELTQSDLKKEKVAVMLPVHLHQRVMWAVLHLAESPPSMSQLFQNAIERELERLEKISGAEIQRHTRKHMGGRPRKQE